MTKDIQIVNRYFYPVLAGIETGIAEAYSQFAERGWRVTVHASCNALHRVNAFPAERGTYRGVAFVRYPFWFFGFFPKLDWNTNGIILLKNFDLFPQCWLLAYAWLLKLVGRKRFTFLVSMHGGFTPNWNDFPWFIRAVKWVYHRTLGVGLLNRAVDGIQALSGFERDELVTRGVRPNLITVIPNGVPEEAFAENDMAVSDGVKQLVASAGAYVVQLGRLHPVKNYETVIRALVKVRTGKFLIVGPTMDARYKRMLHMLAQTLGVYTHVVMTGELRGADKYFILRHARAMVHLAHYEMYPNAILDGMSQGLPLIVSDIPQITEIVNPETNGFVVRADDANTVAEKLSLVFEHPDDPRIRAMREANREFSAGERWSEIVKRIDAWFAKTVIDAAKR